MNVKFMFRMVLQETFILTDAVLIENETHIRRTLNSKITPLSNGEYLFDLNDTSSTAFFGLGNNGVLIGTVNGDTIEFDVTAYTGTVQLRFDDSPTFLIRTIRSIGHYKLVYEGTSVKLYLDGVLVDNLSCDNTTRNFQFRVSANSSVTVKNWLYY